jgi:hypothetical protein
MHVLGKANIGNPANKANCVFRNNVQTRANNVGKIGAGKIGAKKPGLKTAVQNCL